MQRADIFNLRLLGVSVLGALFFRLLGRYHSGYPYGEFREIRPQPLSEFSPRAPLPPIAEEIRKEKNSVAIHVRRGDYVNNEDVNFIGIDYFIRAAEYMKKKLREPVFFVFSDDLNWARKNIGLEKFEKVVFVDNVSPSSDMAVSSLAKNHIIINSTFVWWCAWLNKNPKKIVVSPRRWHIREPNDIKTSRTNLPEWIAM